VIKLFNIRQLTQDLSCDPERRLVQGGRTFFFFMMGDAVSTAAGAERPDDLSEMTAAASGLRLWEHSTI
jgi:hypothetical protein